MRAAARGPSRDGRAGDTTKLLLYTQLYTVDGKLLLPRAFVAQLKAFIFVGSTAHADNAAPRHALCRPTRALCGSAIEKGC